MTINEEVTPEVMRISGSKELVIAAGKKICVTVDGAEDTDLSYTVPSGKTLSVTCYLAGILED